jgi:hypothetical protein
MKITYALTDCEIRLAISRYLESVAGHETSAADVKLQARRAQDNAAIEGEVSVTATVVVEPGAAVCMRVPR